MHTMTRLYLKKFCFWLFLMQLSSHVLQGIERGTQPTPASQMATTWDPAAWPSPSGSYGAGMSGLVASPSAFTLNLSDYVDTSTQQNTGTRSTASAAAGSAAQLHDQMQEQTKTDSARDDVTEQERDPNM